MWRVTRGRLGLKLARMVDRFVSSDWLIILLAVALVAFLAVNALSWARNVSFAGVEPHYLPYFLSLAVLLGFGGVWVKQKTAATNREVRRVEFWQAIAGSLWFGLIGLGLPLMIFYGASSGSSNLTVGFDFGAAIGAGLLEMAALLAGAILSQLKSGWRVVALIALIMLLIQLAGPVTIIERSLTQSAPTQSWLVVLLGLGLLGAIGALAEWLRPTLLDNDSRRYLNIFKRQDSFPSFTGLGGWFFAGIFLLVRDKIWLAAVALLILAELLPLNYLTVTSTGLIFLLSLPFLGLSLLTQELLGRFNYRLSTGYEHLPLEPSASRFVFLCSGLVTLVIVGWAVLFGLLNLPFWLTVNLLGVIGAAYTIADLLVKTGPISDGRVFPGAWRMIYRMIIFGAVVGFVTVFSVSMIILLAIFLTSALLFFSPYRQASGSATIRS